MKILYSIGLLALVTACASPPSNLHQINRGDSKVSVIERLGPPGDRQFQDGNEALQYCTTGTSFGASTFHTIWLFDDVVTGMNTYTVNHAGSCRGHFRQIRWDEAPDRVIELRRTNY